MKDVLSRFLFCFKSYRTVGIYKEKAEEINTAECAGTVSSGKTVPPALQ